MDLVRFESVFTEINKFGGTNDIINRLAYTSEERGALKYIELLCINEGLDTRIDSCGNLIARREGEDPTLPAVACGSHIDTVYDGGKYDGVVGVLTGLEAIRRLNDKNINTLHPIELIVFACEESSRFGVSTIGSKAIVGALTFDSITNLRDKNGVTMQQAFIDSNLDFNSMDKCKRSNDELKAFIELHIEQGPHLENGNKQIGIITGIAAPHRLKIKVKGVASHSGSTSMLDRKDALLGAAEIALILEKAAREESNQGTVGTVGTLDINPGAINVVPGYAEMKIDIRGIYKDSKELVLNKLMEGITQVGENRGLNITWEILSQEDPVLTDEDIQERLISNCKILGLNYMLMPSGAGHDAMNMAKICPTGMVFIPSKDGLSHNPKEYTSMIDINNGLILLEKTLLDLAINVV